MAWSSWSVTVRAAVLVPPSDRSAAPPLGDRVRQGVRCQRPESELQADSDEEQENGQDDDQLGRAGTVDHPTQAH